MKELPRLTAPDSIQQKNLPRRSDESETQKAHAQKKRDNQSHFSAGEAATKGPRDGRHEAPDKGMGIKHPAAQC